MDEATRVNRVLAEKLMGWKLVDAFPPDELCPDPPKEWEGSRGKVPVGDQMTDSSEVWNPHSDRNHLAMCLEKLSEAQWGRLSYSCINRCDWESFPSIDGHIRRGIVMALRAFAKEPATLATILAGIVEGE